MRSVNAFERCYGKVIYSRVSQRRVLRGESHQGSLGESLRKRKERERKDSKSSLLREGEKCEACGEGDGEGRTSGARNNDGDAWHTNRTAPTTVHSHTPRGSITTNSPQNGISRNVTRQLHRKREMSRPCSTLHLGAHPPSARRCGRRDDVSSSPSPSDVM